MKKDFDKSGKMLLSISLVFLPQIALLFLKNNGNAQWIFFVSAIMIVALLYREEIRKLSISKDGMTLEMKETIKELYATMNDVKEVVVPIEILTLKLMENADYALTPMRLKDRLLCYHCAVRTKKTLNVHDGELNNAIKEAQVSVLEGFSDEFRLMGLSGDLQIDEGNILSMYGWRGFKVNIGRVRDIVQGKTISQDFNNEKKKNAIYLVEQLVDFYDEWSKDDEIKNTNIKWLD